MNVVNFAEGILGIDKKFGVVVAECLRQISEGEPEDVAFSMKAAATHLKYGGVPGIELIRKIGEKPLADTQRLFLSL